MSQPSATGHAPVNGLEMYWESYGTGDTPLVVVHGGFALISMEAELIGTLAARRQVVAVELQGHGHTRDVDRPFSYEAFGDDLAGLLEDLDLWPADLLGYSLGAGACLRAAIQHAGLVRRLAAVSFPFRRDGWFPEVRAAFDEMGGAGFATMKQSPLYAAWSEVAPDRDAFPTLMDKLGALQRQPYDWSEEIKGVTAQTLLAYADADSIPASHAAEFFALLGGGLRDAGLDGSDRPQARLAIIPDRTHYDIFQSGQLTAMLDDFFG